MPTVIFAKNSVFAVSSSKWRGTKTTKFLQGDFVTGIVRPHLIQRERGPVEALDVEFDDGCVVRDIWQQRAVSSGTIDMSLGQTVWEAASKNTALLGWAGGFAYWLAITVPYRRETLQPDPLPDGIHGHQRYTICEAVCTGVAAASMVRRDRQKAVSLCSEYFKSVPCVGNRVNISPDVLIDLFTVGWKAVEAKDEEVEPELQQSQVLILTGAFTQVRRCPQCGGTMVDADGVCPCVRQPLAFDELEIWQVND